MNDTASTQANTGFSFNENILAAMADTTMKNAQQAMQTGMKLQEEAGRWWSSMVNQAPFAQAWQKRFMSCGAVAQNPIEDVMTLMKRNSHASAELMRKAVDAAQTPGLPESQAKWMEFWASSLELARSNAQTISQINTQAIDSWIYFVRRS